MDGPRPHRPTIELLESFPTEAQVGTTIDFTVRVSCHEGCDLGGGVLEVVDADGTVQTSQLSRADVEEGVVADLSVKAPPRTGAAKWAIGFPEQEIGGCVHEEGSLAFACEVLPHTTSMAIWGVPTPMKGSRFTVNVGIKCSALCPLGGQLVEIWDGEGVKLGEGKLGDEPRPDTDGLYEGEVTLTAPDRTGVFSASVGFSPDELDLPHVDTAGDFTFRCVELPEHTVTVRVVHEEIDAPLGDIEVRLGPYQAMTDSEGVAGVAVAKGTYELSLWRIDIEPVSMRVKVTGDTEIDVAAAPRRIVDEDEERMWM